MHGFREEANVIKSVKIKLFRQSLFGAPVPSLDRRLWGDGRLWTLEGKVLMSNCGSGSPLLPQFCCLSPLVSARPTSGLHLHTQRRGWQTAAVKPARGVFPPFPAHCGGLLVAAESALSCRSSAASFSPLKHLQKSGPRPAVMNKGALPPVPWALFPGCYTECVLLAKPVMDVGLPLSLCPPDKEGISLH